MGEYRLIKQSAGSSEVGGRLLAMEMIIKKEEKKQMANIGSLYSNDHDNMMNSNSTGIFGSFTDELGFMELLGAHQYQYQDLLTGSSSTIFDLPNLLSTPSSLPPNDYEANYNPKKHSSFKIESSTTSTSTSSEVLNQPPASPNSSSVNDDHCKISESAHLDQEAEEEEKKKEEQQQTKKQLKGKKTKDKRERMPRIAFMTKSEVDHLEDGYRWRKYGQKAVKNSPFPRNYYRCTSASCNVKKRVERSYNDPSIVVTTYEGQHIHPSPFMSRPLHLAAGSSANYANLPLMPRTRNLINNDHHYDPHDTNSLSLPSSFGYHNIVNHSNDLSNAAYPRDLHEKWICNTGPATLLAAADYGLLQDIVPSHMLKH